MSPFKETIILLLNPVTVSIYSLALIPAVENALFAFAITVLATSSPNNFLTPPSNCSNSPKPATASFPISNIAEPTDFIAPANPLIPAIIPSLIKFPLIKSPNVKVF